MAEATFTFRVDEDLKSAFGDAAKAKDQTSAQLLRAFMRDYVKTQHDEAAYDVWFRQQVEAGLKSADAGHLLPGADVKAVFAAKRQATRHKIGE